MSDETEAERLALQKLPWVLRWRFENKLHTFDAHELMTKCAPLSPRQRDELQQRWAQRSMIGILFGANEPAARVFARDTVMRAELAGLDQYEKAKP